MGCPIWEGLGPDARRASDLRRRREEKLITTWSRSGSVLISYRELAVLCGPLTARGVSLACGLPRGRSRCARMGLSGTLRRFQPRPGRGGYPASSRACRPPVSCENRMEEAGGHGAGRAAGRRAPERTCGRWRTGATSRTRPGVSVWNNGRVLWWHTAGRRGPRAASNITSR